MSNQKSNKNLSRRDLLIQGSAAGVALFLKPLYAGAQIIPFNFIPMRGSTSKTYIEDVFAVDLYVGDGGAQTIKNGLDLSGKGGLVWMKSRSTGGAPYYHWMYDTARGEFNSLSSEFTNGNFARAFGVTYNSDGFTFSGDNSSAGPNYSGGANHVAWAFREASKFFDIVTYTGDGAGSKNISHSLGGTVGAIFVKRTNGANNWVVWHRGIPSQNNIRLNTADSATDFGAPDPIDVSGSTTSFTVGAGPTADDNLNVTGANYIAYIFGHDTTADGLIKCDTVSADGSGNATVSLGWEPQYILIKPHNTTATHWYVFDSMRGMSLGADTRFLSPNNSSGEFASAPTKIHPTATGFKMFSFGSTYAYTYIAIRRGPMRIPTDATKVFSSRVRTGNDTNASLVSAGFSPDLVIVKARQNTSGTYPPVFFDRLRGPTNYLRSSGTNVEISDSTTLQSFESTGYKVGIDGTVNNSAQSYVHFAFRRAPGFLDIVCYEGTGSTATFNHNLTVAPEMMIVKSRSHAQDWVVMHKDLATTSGEHLTLNSVNSKMVQAGHFNSTAPTSTVFTVGNTFATNGGAGYTYVAYLFASVANVSKVGSYTGNGTSQTINCGFLSGARFILVKRTDAVGDWYVWDVNRGIGAGNDPRISLNSTMDEIASDDSVGSDSSGFTINQVAATNINVNGATYIYLAIA